MHNDRNQVLCLRVRAPYQDTPHGHPWRVARGLNAVWFVVLA